MASNFEQTYQSGARRCDSLHYVDITCASIHNACLPSSSVV